MIRVVEPLIHLKSIAQQRFRQVIFPGLDEPPRVVAARALVEDLDQLALSLLLLEERAVHGPDLGLKADELVRVAAEITKRLAHTKGKAVFMMPRGGTGSYAMEGGELRDPEGDEAFFDELKAKLPKTIEIVERDTHAEDPEFVKECVDRLIWLIEEG